MAEIAVREGYAFSMTAPYTVLRTPDLSFGEIVQDYYPDLTTEDIRACIQYAIALVAAEEIHLTAVPT